MELGTIVRTRVSRPGAVTTFGEKIRSSPVTFERALSQLFGVKRIEDVPTPDRWTAWKQPKSSLAIDMRISKLRRAGRGVKLLAREDLDGRQSPFGPIFCPYYTARQYLLRAIGSAQRVHNRERELDRARSRNLEIKGELDRITLDLERLLGLQRTAVDTPLAWPRNLVLSVVDRQTGMIDMHDEAARAAEVFKIVNRLRKYAIPTIHEARLLSTFLDKEVSSVTHEGRPIGVWDRSFIEEIGGLYRILTGAEPAQSEVFISFVNSAYGSISRRGDQGRQIKAVLKTWRSPDVTNAKSSALIMGDGRIYARKQGLP
ncbi:hypothetical protein ACVOMS_29710 [Bradyrhizobium guangxiense]